MPIPLIENSADPASREPLRVISGANGRLSERRMSERLPAIRHFLCLLAVTSAVFAKTAPQLNTDTTPSGIPYGWVGERPTKPAATVIFLGASIKENLSLPHYLDGVYGLWPDIWCVTIDIPGHGSETAEGEPGGISTWRYRLEKDKPFLSEFTRRASSVLDHWIEKKYTDPSRIGLFGTSRGGYISFQLAAAEPRVRAIAAFAPVTDLMVLTEFKGMSGDHRARIHGASRLADALHDRAIWMTMGTTDYRVGTQQTIEFTEHLIEAAVARGHRPGVVLHLGPSEGHRVPEITYPHAAAWMVKQLAPRK